MGNRLSKIYTKTGDKGTTAVSDGIRISKTHPRIRALGALDHLNAHLGLVLCEDLPAGVHQQIARLQHVLFDIGGELSMPELVCVNEESITALEQDLDMMNQDLPPLKDFILPGGSKASALCHIARTECRKVETLLIELSNPAQQIRPEILAYINRLSDWFFVAARFVIHWQGKPEVLWQNPYTRP